MPSFIDKTVKSTKAPEIVWFQNNFWTLKIGLWNSSKKKDIFGVVIAPKGETLIVVLQLWHAECSESKFAGKIATQKVGYQWVNSIFLHAKSDSNANVVTYFITRYQPRSCYFQNIEIYWFVLVRCPSLVDANARLLPMQPLSKAQHETAWARLLSKTNWFDRITHAR